MPQVDTPALMLILLALLGVVSRNNSITVASVVLLLLRVLHADRALPWLEKNGLTWGVILLTIGILAPIASGSIRPKQVLDSFLQWQSLAAVGVGVLVAYLGGRGTQLMAGNPTIVTSLLIGTIVGVAFMRGVPVGPLIAAGILSLVIGR